MGDEANERTTADYLEWRDRRDQEPSATLGAGALGNQQRQAREEIRRGFEHHREAMNRSTAYTAGDRIADSAKRAMSFEEIAKARAQAEYDAHTALNQARRPPLHEIADRINEASIRLREQIGRLNNHADSVSGSVPTKPEDDRVGRDDPAAALDRIFYALDFHDRMLAELAYAADRNCNLA